MNKTIVQVLNLKYAKLSKIGEKGVSKCKKIT